MEITKWYDDELQSVQVEVWDIILHLMVEPENIKSWEYWLAILWDFIENPMNYYVWMCDWRKIYNTDSSEIDIEFCLWYQDDQWDMQLGMWWLEIWLKLDKKELLYFAWALKDCIKCVKENTKKEYLFIDK